MRKSLLLLIFQMIFTVSFAVNPTNTFFVDFGTNFVTNASIKANPDVDDNVRNKFINSGLNSSIQFVSTTNTATAYSHLNMMKIEEYDDLGSVGTNDTIFANSPNFSYVGRVDFTNNKKPLFAYANTAIRTKFQGTSVSMLLNQYAGSGFSENSFYAIVDNGVPLKIIASVGKTNYPIANKLDNTIHNLEIIKITEGYCGQCEFLGLILDKGKVIEMPDALPALRIEYYGASSTGGYGIEGGDRPASDNSYKADPAVCARKLNAQLNVISLSGFGMAVGWSATSVIGTIWDKTIPVLSNPAPANNTWDFSQYTPDVVVIELGTNDYNAPGGLKTALTVEQYKSVYKDFISKLRQKYPNAKIICTNSYMLPDPGFGIISHAVQSVVSEVETSGDKKVYYYGFSKMIGGGYNGHPGVTDGTDNGLAMAAFIKDSVLNALDNTAVINP